MKILFKLLKYFICPCTFCLDKNVVLVQAKFNDSDYLILPLYCPICKTTKYRSYACTPNKIIAAFEDILSRAYKYKEYTVEEYYKAT